MADKTLKHPRNTTGPFYVDASCIDCDLCRSMSPQFLTRDEDTGYTFVHHQPQTPAEIAEANATLGACPTDSIGNDGDSPPTDSSTSSTLSTKSTSA